MDGWFFSKHPNLWCRWAQSLPPLTPPSSTPQMHTHPPLLPHLWLGLLKKNKKFKFGFQGLTFEVAIVGLWNTDVNSHAKMRGQMSLSVYLLKESQKGDQRWPRLTPWDYSWSCDLQSLDRLLKRGDRCWRANHAERNLGAVSIYHVVLIAVRKIKRNAAKLCGQRR